MSIEGKWVLDKGENFDKYGSFDCAQDVGDGSHVTVPVALLKENLDYKKEGNKYILKSTLKFDLDEESTITRNSTLEFVLGEMFYENTSDGQKLQTKVDLVDGKLVQKQAPNKKDLIWLPNNPPMTTTIRWVEGDRLYTKFTCGDIECRREYIRQ